MTESSALEPGRIVAGRYRVERQIGEGGVGSVYLVRHLHTDEELALKVLQTHALRDASAVDRFRKEARAPARIGGEHVTRVTDADTAPDLDNAPFLVMELLRGRDLTQVVTERGPLAPALVLELLRQAGRALDKAHTLGIIHRDLKPDNLFLTERDDGSPCIKLLDFGIARLGDAAVGEAMPQKTQAGLVFGTPGYMAPEQMTGEMDLIAPATDVWAVGLVAFYLLVGHDFWDSATLAQLYAAILAAPIPLPSQRGSSLGEPFDIWFGRCVRRDPAERFQTVGEAIGALPAALGLRVSAPPVSLPPLDSVVRGPSRPDLPPLASPSAPPLLPAVSVPPPGTGPNPVVVVSMMGAAIVGLVVLGGVAVWALGASKGDGTQAAMTTAAEQSPPPVTAAISSAPSGAVPAARPDASPRLAETPDAAQTPAAVTARDTAPRPAWDPRARAATREQQDRLDALQRLCDQGTVTAAECAAKRGAILRGDP